MFSSHSQHLKTHETCREIWPSDFLFLFSFFLLSSIVAREGDIGKGGKVI